MSNGESCASLTSCRIPCLRADLLLDGRHRWFNSCVTWYDELIEGQLDVIDGSEAICRFIEDEPLSPVSVDKPDKTIEGFVTEPNTGLSRLILRPTVYWRRAVSRDEASDVGNNRYDVFILYRTLRVHERVIRFNSEIRVRSICHKKLIAKQIPKWWSQPL